MAPEWCCKDNKGVGVAFRSVFFSEKTEGGVWKREAETERYEGRRTPSSPLSLSFWWLKGFGGLLRGNSCQLSSRTSFLSCWSVLCAMLHPDCTYGRWDKQLGEHCVPLRLCLFVLPLYSVMSFLVFQPFFWCTNFIHIIGESFFVMVYWS